jgi:hypothetical protein
LTFAADSFTSPAYRRRKNAQVETMDAQLVFGVIVDFSNLPMENAIFQAF